MSFSPGAALARTGTVWLRGLVPFTVFAFVVRLPTVLWIPTDPEEFLRWFFLSVCLDIVAVVGIGLGVYERLQGRGAGVLKVTRGGIARLVPVAGVLFVSFLAAGGAFATLAEAKLPTLVILALLLLAYPLLHFLVITMVAIPVAVVERPDTLGAFARSAALTHGRRLLVLAIVASVWIACTLTREWIANLPWPVTAWKGAWIDGTIGAVFAVPPAVALSVVYHDLREDPPPVEQVAEVFE